MDLQTFGEKIKTKYPQYNSVDSIELANKIIAKYPQYKSVITVEQSPTYTQDAVSDVKGTAKSIVQSIKERAEGYRKAQAGEIPGQTKFEQKVTAAGELAGGVSDVFSNVITGVAKAVLPQGAEDKVNNLLQKVGTAVSNTELAQKYNEWKNENPADAKAIEGVVNIASLIPVGAGASAVGEGVEQTAKGVIKGTTTAGKGALNVAKAGAETTSDIAQVGGRLTKKLGEKVASLGIRPLTKEAEIVQSFAAKNPLPSRVASYAKGTAKDPQTVVKTALEKNIMGRGKDIGIFAERQAGKIYSEKINPALKALDETGETIKTSELFDKAQELVQKEADPTRQEALANALEDLQNSFSSKGEYSYGEAEKLKQALNKRTPQKLFKGQDITNEVQTLKKQIADSIREKIYNKLGNDIKKEYLNYGNLQQLKGLGVKSRTQAGRLGGAGSLVSFIVDQAVVPVSTVGGNIIYKIGDAFEFIGKKGKNYKYSEDVIKDFIDSLNDVSSGAVKTAKGASGVVATNSLTKKKEQSPQRK